LGLGSPLGLHRFALLTAGATFVLLIAGALVTSNEAGDSVPDWPLAYGQVVPWSVLVGNVLYEYGHRVIAATVGLLTILLNVWLWRRESRGWVRRLGLIALVAVVAQGVLGGVRVLLLEYRLPVSVVHATLAQTFFCLVVSLALITSPGWQRMADGRWPMAELEKTRLARWCAAATAAIFAQLILGAAFRHEIIGIAAHIVGAVVVTVLLGGAVRLALRDFSTGSVSDRSLTLPVLKSYLRRPALAAGGLLALQLVLGVAAYFARVASLDDPQPLEPMVSLTVAHVAVGALVLAATLVLTLRTFQTSRIGHQTSPISHLTSHISNSKRSEVRGLRSYVELTKPRITLLILLTAVAGFCLGANSPFDYVQLMHTAVGIGLLSAGIATLNQYLEREVDGRMRRTQTRPLPAQRLAPGRALWFGIALSTAAETYLTLLVNPLTALLGVVAFSSYLFLYTPLKTRTPLCTAIGAIPGAMPPLMGWTAAQGELSVGGWVLFLILFLWQFPHFLAIAWLYRDDYARAGIRMLPVVEPEGKGTRQQIVSCTFALVPVSLLPALVGVSGSVYLVGALVLGGAFLYVSLVAAREVGPSLRAGNRQAQRLLLASVFYLPLLFGLMVLGK
jgi:protoheme IX farnesyltransferase